MAAIMNGLALHGGFIPYGGTFLTFSRLRRNAIRMAALMSLRVDLRVHARFDRPRRGRADAPAGRARASLRLIPQPGRLAAVRYGRDGGRRGRRAIERSDGPTRLLLSRQNLPFAAARRRRSIGGDRARRLRACRTAGAAARDRDRDRLRSWRSRWTAQKRWRPKASPCASSRCRQRERSTARIAAYREQRAARRRAERRGRGRRDARCWRKYVGARRRAWSASTASASRRRRAELFEHFGFTPSVSRRSRRCAADREPRPLSACGRGLG